MGHSLEFCQMILETKNYAGADITPYLPLIESSLTFFDEHYRLLASRRGRKALDGNGHLVPVPGSACKTKNTSSTIACEPYWRLTSKFATMKSGKRCETNPPVPLRYIEVKDSLNPDFYHDSGMETDDFSRRWGTNQQYRHHNSTHFLGASTE